jgi:hypothetical protein
MLSQKENKSQLLTELFFSTSTRHVKIILPLKFASEANDIVFYWVFSVKGCNWPFCQMGIAVIMLAGSLALFYCMVIVLVLSIVAPAE